MERRYYKAINFDLDTRLLNQYHPTKGYHNAYYDMRKFFKHHGFYHKQGSGYVSQQKISSQDIYLLIDALYEENDWIAYCVKEFDVTNIGTQYELAADIRANLDKDEFAI